ncbi:hypothetical protein CAMM_06850 [Corynebacterium ammoniagenes DSM 20306]|uniref:Uncharacterized protein n=1 Tax=Corynebacterium ammoniagenes TaxID=1697 RepID=A0AAV5G775_CORAM|nr:hypothetical protein CAMM_06850 [Corynebacterium ammoniagenes DSM 20306]AQS73713.1 hypothetical protein CA40472_07175 [Corynebacterium ammoniagenes]GJN42484.1 hypothetical protein CAT723_09630 [Corynebacterium ammoniagenes]
MPESPYLSRSEHTLICTRALRASIKTLTPNNWQWVLSKKRIEKIVSANQLLLIMCPRRNQIPDQ